jgi:SSS family transporter
METAIGGLHWVDIVIIFGYLVAVALLGSLSGGRQTSTRDYFLGGKNIPWWAVAFAIVAAETSTLTFISIPGLAYLTNLNFLQVTFGYLLGRIIVSLVLLPSYYKGELLTAYALLENRFGRATRTYASTVFIFTRVAADGVRLFATSIPLALILRTFPWFAGFSNLQIYLFAIVVIAGVTLIYTYTGGIKGIIWVDVLQMSIYLGGALLALGILLSRLPNWTTVLTQLPGGSAKLQLLNLDFSDGLRGFFAKPYTLIGSLIGGTFLSMASHGTDQLIVQRLLTTRSLRDGQKALIASGVIVILQFTLFMLVGLLLYVFYGGMQPGATAPFSKADEVFPYFIIHNLPIGVKGLIIAGLLAAAMSTLAGSISSLSSSALADLYKPRTKRMLTPAAELRLSRLWAVGWALVLTLVATFFIKIPQAVVEIALSIASITYGGLLGTFLLGVLFKRIDQTAAIWGFSIGILAMLLIICIPIGAQLPALVYWTWYTLIGCTVTIVVGNLVYYFRSKK